MRVKLDFAQQHVCQGMKRSSKCAWGEEPHFKLRAATTARPRSSAQAPRLVLDISHTVHLPPSPPPAHIPPA